MVTFPLASVVPESYVVPDLYALARDTEAFGTFDAMVAVSSV